MELKLIKHSRALAFLILLGSVAFAQSVQLSPEQQLMLNQLPPDQRARAMEALRQLDSPDQASRQSINETISEYVVPEPEAIAALAEEMRAEARSRMVIEFSFKENVPAAERRRLGRDSIIQRLLGSRLFVLDESGVLELQGLNPIQLLGLTEEDIERRLEAEPHLSSLVGDARILSQEPIGIEALAPFGYDVFERRDTSLLSPMSGPVPQDYVLGPGDTVRVQLFGNVNGIYEFEVSRDGILNLPELGPITVAGIPFSEFRQDLHTRVQEMLIGTQVSVTMGQLRTIRVFVLGDVERPGSYVVNSLATMSSALYQGGGSSEVGTLRNIQLKRNGKVVSRLDLYDLLLSGDTSGDKRLQPGDVIFVPPIGDTVSVIGAVKRPAIYETDGKTSVAEILDIAGGLTAEAFDGGVRLERIDGDRRTIAIDLSDSGDSGVAASTNRSIFENWNLVGRSFTFVNSSKVLSKVVLDVPTPPQIPIPLFRSNSPS